MRRLPSSCLCCDLAWGAGCCIALEQNATVVEGWPGGELSLTAELEHGAETDKAEAVAHEQEFKQKVKGASAALKDREAEKKKISATLRQHGCLPAGRCHTPQPCLQQCSLCRHSESSRVALSLDPLHGAELLFTGCCGADNQLYIPFCFAGHSETS